MHIDDQTSSRKKWPAIGFAVFLVALPLVLFVFRKSILVQYHLNGLTSAIEKTEALDLGSKAVLAKPGTEMGQAMSEYSTHRNALLELGYLTEQKWKIEALRDRKDQASQDLRREFINKLNEAFPEFAMHFLGRDGELTLTMSQEQKPALVDWVENQLTQLQEQGELNGTSLDSSQPKTED